jgi:hypothetical protein
MSLGTRRLIGFITVVLAGLLIAGYIAEPTFTKLLTAVLL